MQVIKYRLVTWTFVSSCVLSVVVLSGCRSGMPELPAFKKPDMGKLAFWKAEDDTKVPPPPAHHFNPAPMGEKKTAKASDSSDIQEQFNRIAEAAKKQKEEFKRDVDTTSKPYKLPDQRAIFEKTTKGIDAEVSKAKTDAKASRTAAENIIAKAQQDFNSAIASSKMNAEDSITRTKQAASNAASSLANDMDFQAKLAKSKTIDAQNQFNAAMSKVNNSIYDSAKGITNNAKQMADNTIKNTLRPNLEAVSAKASGMIDDSVASARSATNAAKAKGAAGLESAQKQVKIAQQQIADLKVQIEAAKAKSNQAIADNAKQATDFAAAAITKPLDRVASLDFATTQPKSGGALAPIPSTKSTNDFSPGNSLRTGGSFSPSGNSSPKSSTAPSYPSTPHESFAPRNGQNQFGSTSAKRGSLIPNQPGNFSPMDKSQMTGTVNKSQVAPASHVSEIEIPKNVLTGKSSYAPGSVNPLQPIK